ncbi:MAG: AIPR family protein [Deltaproteobacteria bacterium]|nr:AIPR family protein [Deltaproteobacteria bacterium]
MAKFIVESPYVRRLPDPVFGPNAQRTIFMVPVHAVPTGIPRDPNPRAPDINKSVWKDIRRHLLNEEGEPNTFHLKNKGITILASEVEKLSEEKYALHFEPGDGIVDGGHTYELLTDAADDIARLGASDVPLKQFVKIEVLTGLPANLVTEIAGGLNTAIQVQSYSLENLRGSFDWLRAALDTKSYGKHVAFRENDDGLIDVRDVLVLLDLFNIAEFPNASSEYPLRAYGSKQNVLESYVAHPEHYKALEPLLHDILSLHDLIGSEARSKHNETGGKAGSLAFVEDKKKGTFDFPFLGRKSEYRLSRAALLPMLGAFRWMVKSNPTSGKLEWDGGYSMVLKVWEAAGGELMRATQVTSAENNRLVHAIGRARNHWQSLHNIVAKHHLMMTRR